MKNNIFDKNASMWGGRFESALDPQIEVFNRSLEFDQRLLEADICGSRAHAGGLLRARVIDKKEYESILGGLEYILHTFGGDRGPIVNSDAEDIHSFIEQELVKKIGDTGKKLHTGRSRNDQVATAMRLWLKKGVEILKKDLNLLQNAFVKIAEDNVDAVMPGYTHLQRAQPIMLAHWSLAYFEMLCRDYSRFDDVIKRMNYLPLGSGALAGNNYDIDREKIAKDLGFDGITQNSLDAVSDRDFCMEFLSSCSILMVHLSRCAEDLILYSSGEFGFVELGDKVSTGSSLMPQKKNPDVPELVRGKSGRVFGNLMGLLTVMKGIPLAYNKDMQEDKEAVFGAFDTVASCVVAMKVFLENIKFNSERMRSAAEKGYMNATDLADYLVKKGLVFREAHEVAGKLVLAAIEENKELGELGLDTFKKISSVIEEDVYSHLTLESSLNSKKTFGSTNPELVKKSIEKAKKGRLLE